MPDSRAGQPPGNGRPTASDATDDAARFRRPERPAGAPGAAPDPAPAPESEGVEEDVGRGLVPGSARTLAEPLAALAAAFQANAEALRRSHEVQADLHRALERADRSEMVVQTTGALNETFKGLTTVQRALAQRVAESEREARTGRMFLPLLVLAAVAVLGAVSWLVLQYVDRWKEQAVGTTDVATQLSKQFQAGVEQGRADEASAGKARLEAHEERVRALEQSLSAAQSERDARGAAAAAAAGELEALRAEVQGARVDALKVKALEDEAERLRREASAKDPELERLRKELAEAREDNAALRRQLGDAALLRTVGKDTPPVPPASAPADGAPPPPEADDPSVNRERRTVDRVRTRVNDLLKAAAATRPDYLQVLSVGGVAPNRLIEVKVGRYNAAGRLLNSIVARDLRVTVDHLRRLVEFQFLEGHVERGDSQAPFAGGTYSAIVAEGDVSAWTSSGFTFVTAK